MKYLTKRIVSAASCLLLLTSAAFATDPGDYGPEAETDFETKQDAYSSGFEWGVEYSSDPSNRDNAYNQGYEEGWLLAGKIKPNTKLRPLPKSERGLFAYYFKFH